jgi:archaellin
MLSTGTFASNQTNKSILSALEEVSGSITLRSSVFAYKGRLGTTVASDTVYKVSIVVSGSSTGVSLDMTPPYTVDGSGIDPDFDSGAQHKTVVSYFDKNQHLPDVPWTANWIGGSNSDNLLDPGESLEISIWLLRRDLVEQPDRATANNGVDHWIGADSNGSIGLSTENISIDRSTTFSVEIKPQYGSTVTIQRRIPTLLDAVMNLR